MKNSSKMCRLNMILGLLWVTGSVTWSLAAPVNKPTGGVDGRSPASSTQHLSGAAADEFIAKHFPNADIPGTVEGNFRYVSAKKIGYAKCFYPAMGEASDGVLPSCDITEGSKHQKISGSAADAFIEKYFPNADIPGPVEGKFIYSLGAKRTGYAKCFVPAMGEASDGVESSCDVKYN